MIAPVLHTGRLTLRLPRLEDFQHRAAFYASERSVWEGGALSRKDVRRIWASELGQWPLIGNGPFSVDGNGDYSGELGIVHGLRAHDFSAENRGAAA